MDSVDGAGSAQVVVDPNVLDEKGSTSIDFYRPSPDGKLVAVSLSSGGSESGAVHIFETSTGKEAFEVVPRVNGGTAGGDLAWTADGTGYFYTRYPAPNERPAEDLAFYQQVFFHKLGSPATEDRYELGKNFPKVAEIRIQTHPKKNYVIASLQAGDGGAITQYLRTPDGAWKQLTNAEDMVVKADFGTNDDVYLVSRKEAPRGKILRLRLTAPRLSEAATILPEGEDVIEADFWGVPAVVDTASRIYLTYNVGGTYAKHRNQQ
jgi:prolyl oligopeptidase